MDQNYRLLAIAQAVTGGLIAVGVFGTYGLVPSVMVSSSTMLPAAVLGAFALAYFLSVHQLIKAGHLALSALILTIISSSNILLIIIATGGLDSPFYSLWLLAIVAAGTFGRAQSVGILGITIAYYVISFVAEGAAGHSLSDRIIQLGITIAAGALAEWVHSRNRQAGAAVKQLAQVSGQLTSEQLKAEAIISSIGEGVMVVDSARKIQIFNTSAQQLSGWDESSAQNLDLDLVLQMRTADDKPLNDMNDPFSVAWRKHEAVVRQDVVMTSRSGRKVQLNLSISPMFSAAGLPSGAVALFRDISREKEVERQKEEFVSTASHEMRTPVAAIEGYISLAMNSNVATIDDRAKSYLDKAHQTITHLGELFRDLLSVTKAEEGQLTAKIEPINLDKLLTEATADMQFTAQKKNLTLIYQIGNQPGKTIAPLFHVAANPERMREVVMNLMENAVKFTPEGGVKVTLDGTDKDITVSVSDSGVGIAQEDIGHLFQKFYRIDNSATRTIGGTGLGLYLCRRVIEAFNGRIWVESKSGEGSTFKFTLPRLSDVEYTQMMASLENHEMISPGSSSTVNVDAAAPVASAPTLGVPATLMPVPSVRPNIDGIRRQIP